MINTFFSFSHTDAEQKMTATSVQYNSVLDNNSSFSSLLDQSNLVKVFSFC